jgi:hypothetical protein
VELKELHAVYGELMIQAEIINARIQETKRAIAEKMNEKVEPKKE